MKKQGPRPALWGVETTASCLRHFWTSRFCLIVAFMFKPPILPFSSSSGPPTSLPEKMREGGKVCVGAGPGLGALEIPGRRLLYLSVLRRAFIFERRVHAEAAHFAPLFEQWAPKIVAG